METTVLSPSLQRPNYFPCGTFDEEAILLLRKFAIALKRRFFANEKFDHIAFFLRKFALEFLRKRRSGDFDSALKPPNLPQFEVNPLAETVNPTASEKCCESF